MNSQSLEAYVAGLLDGTLESNRAKVYRHLVGRQSTCEETEIALNMRHQSASSAINYLRANAGAIEACGDLRRTSTGRWAMVYRVTPLDPQRSLL